jgi:dihydroorotate dehydrogenase (NAD+) catalytic subunit
VAGLEANISCPNVKAGGIEFGIHPDIAGKLVERIKAVAGKPLWVKLSPNVTDIAAIAKAVEQAGADAISAINTLKGMAIDLDKRQPILANVTGGLSGPAIKPIALRMVYEIARAVKIPVVGIGGIVTARDALEFLVAGASAVQIGTASFLDPRAPIQIINGIKSYFREHNIESVQEIIGTLKVAG